MEMHLLSNKYTDAGTASEQICLFARGTGKEIVYHKDGTKGL